MEVAALDVPKGLFNIFNFEDLFNSKRIFKSGSSIKQSYKEYMFLSSNVSFLEEPFAFLFSDRNTAFNF